METVKKPMKTVVKVWELSWRGWSSMPSTRPMSWKEKCEEMLNQHPDSDIVMFDTAHHIHHEAPAEVLQEIIAFQE